MSTSITADTRDAPTAKAGSERRSPLQSKALRIGLLIAGLAAVAIGAALLIQWWTTGRFMQGTDDAYLQADQVTVAPRVSGYVEEVLVGDNQWVAAGQPLVRIDPRDPLARLQQAEAQVDQGRASIAQDDAQISQQQAQVAQARAQLAGSRSSAAYADRQVERYAPLGASGAETGEHVDQLRQNRDQAASQAAAGAAQVLGAQRQIDTLRAQIKVAEAQVEGAQAQARQAQVDVDGAVVKSSIAGRVGDRSVRPGQYVQPGTKLLSVVPVQAIYLVANFKETQIGRMRPGQPVTVKIDALGGQSVPGVIDGLAPGTGAQFALIPPSNATGNFTKIVQRVAVRIRLNPPESVRPVLVAGLSATVSVDTRDVDPADLKASLARSSDPRSGGQ